MAPRRKALVLRTRLMFRRQQRSMRSIAPGQLVQIIAGGMILAILGDANIYVSLPTHTAEAGIPLVYVGLMQAMNRITRIIINGPYGILLERVPRRPLMIFSLLLGAISNLCYLVPGFWPLLIGRILWGVCWAGIWLGGHAMIFDIADEQEYGERTGQVQMGFWIGAGVSSFFSGILTDWLGYREFFVVAAVCVFLGWFCWIIWLPETFGRRKAARESGGAGVDVPAETPAPRQQTRHRRWEFGATLLLAFINWFIFLGVAGSFWPIMVDQRTTAAFRTLPLVGELGVSSFTGIMTAVVILLVNALAAPWIGRLSDRLGRSWLMLAAAVLLGAVTMLLSAQGYGVVILIGIFFQGLVMSILGVLITAQMGRTGPARQTGRRLGLLNICGDMGGALGPLLAFALLPLIGLAGVLYGTAVVLILILPPVVWLALQEKRLTA
ncbi:MAG: MFS transporter [Chloroflexi bacterium]|nr:MFS transporter [Chloroflexota bacterium]